MTEDNILKLTSFRDAREEIKHHYDGQLKDVNGNYHSARGFHTGDLSPTSESEELKNYHTEILSKNPKVKTLETTMIF